MGLKLEHVNNRKMLLNLWEKGSNDIMLAISTFWLLSYPRI